MAVIGKKLIFSKFKTAWYYKAILIIASILFPVNYIYYKEVYNTGAYYTEIVDLVTRSGHDFD